MRDINGQKKENVLGVLRGGRYAERPMRTYTTAEFRLDREMQAVIGAIRGEDGRAPSRAIARVAYEEQRPWRVLARRFVEARRKRAKKAQLLAVIEVLRCWVDRLYEDAPDLAA
jgi:hypothetical protein